MADYVAACAAKGLTAPHRVGEKMLGPCPLCGDTSRKDAPTRPSGRFNINLRTREFICWSCYGRDVKMSVVARAIREATPERNWLATPESPHKPKPRPKATPPRKPPPRRPPPPSTDKLLRGCVPAEETPAADYIRFVRGVWPAGRPLPPDVLWQPFRGGGGNVVFLLRSLDGTLRSALRQPLDALGEKAGPAKAAKGYVKKDSYFRAAESTVRADLRKHYPPVFCEGPLDALALRWVYLFHPVYAACGCHYGVLPDGAIIVSDPDPEGRNGARTAKRRNLSVRLRLLRHADGLDAADQVKALAKADHAPFPLRTQGKLL